MKVCEKCLSNNEDNNNFCIYCGSKLLEGLKSQEVNNLPPQIEKTETVSENEETFVGNDGNVIVNKTKRKIIIHRKSFNLLAQNWGLKGDKEIYIKNITSVQLKKPSLGIANGFIEFSVSGSIDQSRGAWIGNTPNENTVHFDGPKGFTTFSRCKELIDSIIEEINNQSFSPVQAPVSNADELSKYAELLSKNIISQEEFNQIKKKLLGV